MGIFIPIYSYGIMPLWDSKADINGKANINSSCNRWRTNSS